jgi:hypothetical protein
VQEEYKKRDLWGVDLAIAFPCATAEVEMFVTTVISSILVPKYIDAPPFPHTQHGLAITETG